MLRWKENRAPWPAAREQAGAESLEEEGAGDVLAPALTNWGGEDRAGGEARGDDSSQVLVGSWEPGAGRRPVTQWGLQRQPSG